jgi:hypothetical protein
MCVEGRGCVACGWGFAPVCHRLDDQFSRYSLSDRHTCILCAVREGGSAVGRQGWFFQAPPAILPRNSRLFVTVHASHAACCALCAFFRGCTGRLVCCRHVRRSMFIRGGHICYQVMTNPTPISFAAARCGHCPILSSGRISGSLRPAEGCSTPTLPAASTAGCVGCQGYGSCQHVRRLGGKWVVC